MEQKKNTTEKLRIGVLSIQGDISEHASLMETALEKTGRKGAVVQVKTKEGLEGIDALVIPGGESTTICKIMRLHGLDGKIGELAKKGLPIMGTCAGLVMLSKTGCEEVEKTGQVLLGLVDAKVERNAFGRQRESFEAKIDIPSIGREPYHAIFIRAPCIKKIGGEAKSLAEYEGRIVAARQKNVLVLAFHPELGDDTRIHEYFLGMIEK